MEKEANNKFSKSMERFTGVSFKSFIIKTFNTVSPNAKFIDNWHIDLIATYLEATREGEVKRLIINIPPRSLKSTIISVAWPAWILGQDPTKRVIVASYSQGLSLKHSGECRLIMETDWYREMFPKTKLRRGSNQKAKFLTTKQGFRFATSIEGTLTGEGEDFLIVDDPHTPLQAASELERERALIWYDQTFSTRLNDKKKGVIMVVMQRLHKNDLSGHLLKKRSWKHLKISAIAENDILYEFRDFKYLRKEGEILSSRREGKKEIAAAKIDLGSYGFSAQYQQEPVSTNKGIIKLHWLKKTKELPKGFKYIYQSWDCAAKAGIDNDYSACTTWGVSESSYYLIDAFREKLEFPDLKRTVVSLAEKFKPSAVLIEDKSSGQAIIQELKKETMLPVLPISPSRDKISRLLLVCSLFEAGKVILPEEAVWLNDFERELLLFPRGDHDDMVDSATQFLEWMRGKDNNISSVRVI